MASAGTRTTQCLVFAAASQLFSLQSQSSKSNNNQKKARHASSSLSFYRMYQHPAAPIRTDYCLGCPFLALLSPLKHADSRGDAMNELCLISQRKHKIKDLEWSIICYVFIKNFPQTFNMKQLPFNSLPVQDESSTALSWAQSTLLLRLGNLQCPYTMTNSWSTYQLDHEYECTKPEHPLLRGKKLITKGQLITLFNNF